VRTDAAAFVVVDTSRSMLAAPAPGSATRLERARRVALAVRKELGDVPVGIASLSDRVLPHLFPSPDRKAFARTLGRALRAGHPVPTGLSSSGTDLTALAALPTANFFAPAMRRRVGIVLTDAESDPIDSDVLDGAYRAVPQTTLVLVRVARAGERVFDEQGRPEPGYVAGPGAGAIAAQVAGIAGGRVFGEGQAAAAGRAAVEALGAGGRTQAWARGERRRPLGPYALVVSALPLAYLVRLRNLGH